MRGSNYLKVVSMLPHINTKKRNQACCGLERILVKSSGDRKAVVDLIEAEPSPAGALNSNSRSGHGSLKILKSAILSLDRCQELSIRNLAAPLSNRGQILPENGVVQVTAALRQTK